MIVYAANLYSFALNTSDQYEWIDDLSTWNVTEVNFRVQRKSALTDYSK